MVCSSEKITATCARNQGEIILEDCSGWKPGLRAVIVAHRQTCLLEVVAALCPTDGLTSRLYGGQE